MTRACNIRFKIHQVLNVNLNCSNIASMMHICLVVARCYLPKSIPDE